MMASMLSIFDPCSCTIFSNWMYIFISLLIPVNSYWKVSSYSSQFMKGLLLSLQNMFKSKYSLFFVSLFIYLLFINITSLTPYSFSLSSHFKFNFSLGFIFWVTIVIWSMNMKFNHLLAHLTPAGCPTVLIPFMVMIEFLSLLIRPLTLSLRLMSNMLAGHMILTLISKALYYFLFFSKPLFLFLDIGFIMFEVMVALIQAYVFTNLAYMYWSEMDFN